MAKNKLKKTLSSKLTYFLIISLFFWLISVYGLRANYSKMVELRNAVNTADKNNGDVELALRNLREHVYSHMNTNLASGNVAIKPPIQLKYRYERLQVQESERVKSVNAKVAADGEAICGASYPAGGFNPNRVKCVQDYVSANAVKENSVADDLYKFDFVSPKWSADLAGISLVLGVVSSFIFLVGLAKAQIKKRYF